jgi:hypothetical protein
LWASFASSCSSRTKIETKRFTADGAVFNI